MFQFGYSRASTWYWFEATFYLLIYWRFAPLLQQNICADRNELCVLGATAVVVAIYDIYSTICSACWAFCIITCCCCRCWCCADTMTHLSGLKCCCCWRSWYGCGTSDVLVPNQNGRTLFNHTFNTDASPSSHHTVYCNFLLLLIWLSLVVGVWHVVNWWHDNDSINTALLITATFTPVRS